MAESSYIATGACLPNGASRAVPQFEPIALDFAQAAALLGISRSKLFEMHKAQTFGPEPVLKAGRLRRFSRAEVVAWFEAGCPPRTKWQAIKSANAGRVGAGRRLA